MVISWINEKGGVGKTSLCFNVGWYLSTQGKKVLFIDMDGQRANLSFFCGIKDDEKEHTMADVLLKEFDIKKSILEVKENLHIVPGAVELTLIDKSIKQEIMTNAIQSVSKYYDFIFIDINPTPSRIHALVMGATDYIIIPMLPDVASLEANKGVIETYNLIKEKVNQNLKIMGIVFNKNNGRALLSKQVNEITKKMADKLNTNIFNTKVRNNIALSENVGSHQGITEYDSNSNGAKDIIDLTNEILEILKGE
jgi:chromosome partitioning protein